MLNHLDEENELFPKVRECLDDEKIRGTCYSAEEAKSL